MGRSEPSNRDRPDDGFRRIFRVARLSGEGPLSEPTAAAQVRKQEPLLMPIPDLAPARSVGRHGVDSRPLRFANPVMPMLVKQTFTHRR